MREAQTTEQLSRPTSRQSPHRWALSRAAGAGAVVIGALAIAAPSWAGPMTGC